MGIRELGAQKPRTVTYGGENTIHDSTELDVEVDQYGKVVAVWFRCRSLPFQQTDVGWERAEEMRTMYEDDWANTPINAIVFEDK